jgi:hypothetical protein
VEEALDYVEADPPDPRAKRRRFTNATWAITVHARRQERLVDLGERTASGPVVRHLGEATSL